MNLFKKIVILIGSTGYFFCFSCLTYSQEALGPTEILGGTTEQDYIYAFSEATKLYLFGNFPHAINLYNECLRIKPSSGACHYQLAKIFMQADEIDMAKKNAKEACKYTPENKWYLQELASIYMIKQEFDSAIIVNKELLSKDSENLNIIFSIATLYERIGKFEEALSYLDKIDEEIGFSKETAVSRYRIYESMNLEMKALEQLKFAIKQNENDYSLAGLVAEFFRKHNKPDSALFYYHKIYPTYKDDPVVVFSFAEFLLEQKEYESAKRVLLDAMKDEEIEKSDKTGYLFRIIQQEDLFKRSRLVLDTVVSEYYYKYYYDVRSMSIYADMEFRLGNYQKSAGVLKRIIAADNQNYAAYEQLIFCENALGNTDSVLQFSREAIIRFPDKPVPYLFYGSASYQKKKYTEALEKLSSGLSLCKNDNLKLEFYSLLAECYVKVNNYDKSDECFKEALGIDKYNTGISNNFAYYLSLRSKDLDFAKELSKRTLKIEPRNSTYLDTYGWILYKMNKPRSARKYVIMAIENGAEKNSEVLMHYGEILKKLEKDDEAIKIWKKALEFADNDLLEELTKRISEAELKIKR